MEMHKQLPSIRLVFLAEGSTRPPSRWLKVSSLPGDRILFFPGLDVDLFRVRGTDGGALSVRQGILTSITFRLRRITACPAHHQPEVSRWADDASTWDGSRVLV